MSTQLSTQTAQPVGVAYRIRRSRTCATRLWFKPQAIEALLEMNEAALHTQGVSV